MIILVDFLLMLIKLFFAGVTAEALRENIDSKLKIGDFAPTGAGVVAPPTILLR